MNGLKHCLINHIMLCCKNDQDIKTIEEVSTDLDRIISRCSAPKTLERFSDIVNLLRLIKGKNHQNYLNILNLLDIEKYIARAFEFELVLENNKIKNEYNKSVLPNSWCEKYPLYTLLIHFKNYEITNSFLDFFIVYLTHYFDCRDELIKPEYSTKKHNREYDVLNQFRRLFTSTSFNVAEIFDGIEPNTVAYSHYIDSLIEDKIVLKSTRSIMQTLSHFFKNDWTTPNERTNTGNAGGGRRAGNRRKIIPDANKDIFVLEPLKQGADHDGFVAEDSIYSPEYIHDNSDRNEQRTAKNVASVASNFDKNKRSINRIDLTSYAIRANNFGRQNLQTLQPNELKTLFDLLEKQKNIPSKQVQAAVLWVMFLLGKTPEEVLELYLCIDTKPVGSGLYIDKSNKGWWFFRVKKSAKFLGMDETVDTIEGVYTPCPEFLVRLINKLHIDKKSIQKLIPQLQKKDKNKLISKITKVLKRVSDREYCVRLSITNITNFISSYISSTLIIDPVFFDFSYELQIYSCRVSRSYAMISEEQRQNSLMKFWSKISEEVTQIEADLQVERLYELRYKNNIDDMYGSKFVPKKHLLIKFIEILKKPLLMKNIDLMKMSDLAEYHNKFVIYISWMLLFGTGYRAVWNPLPTFMLCHTALNLMSISDKDNNDFSHARVVAVPSELCDQLEEYKRHLGCLRGLIRILQPDVASKIDLFINESLVLKQNKKNTSDWYKSKKNSRINSGPLFILVADKKGYKTKPVSPTYLAKQLTKGLHFPCNSGRHFLKNYLQNANMRTELINFQMGHWHTGENPFGMYSSLACIPAIEEIFPILDRMFKELTWIKLQSQII